MTTSNSSLLNPLPPHSSAELFTFSDSDSDRGDSSEDENPPTQHTHSATWAGQNAAHPVIKSRMPSWPLTEAVKQAHKIAREQKQEANERLQNAITTFIAEQNAKMEDIAKAHNVKQKWVEFPVVNQTQYRTTRKAQLYNALVSAKAREVNASECLLFTQYFY